MPTIALTPGFINKPAKSNAERAIYWDKTLPGFGLMVTRGGHKSYVVQYRANGISRRMTIDAVLPLAAARKEARAHLGRVAKGHDPLDERRRQANAAKNSLESVCEDYMDREGNDLRSADARARILKDYVYPKLGSFQIEDIKRSDIVRLLDRIEDNHGPAQADYVLAVIRKIMNWHASRSDDFRSPVVRGMSRTKPKERQRRRKLSDIELCAFWNAADASGSAYSYMLQLILLTATRLREAANMSRGELSRDGTEWTIPAKRYKGQGASHDHLIPLSTQARALLEKPPEIGKKGWIFTTSGKTPISGFSKFKAAFDPLMRTELQKIDPATTMERWTPHDLRRTARSLMSRAGVDPDHAERCLGHVIPGVRGVYDRHEFRDEKADAFERLAALVERIRKTVRTAAP
jgi:integrase